MRIRQRIWIVGVVASACLAGCTLFRDREGVGESSSFRTLRRGSGGDAAKVAVARTQEEYEALWAQLFRRDSSPPEAPAVDFAKETVVGVLRGCLPNTCFQTSVRQVTRAGDGVKVWVQDVDPGANCQCGLAMTCPYHVVAVPRFEGQAEVQRTTQLKECTPQRRP